MIVKSSRTFVLNYRLSGVSDNAAIFMRNIDTLSALGDESAACGGGGGAATSGPATTTAAPTTSCNPADNDWTCCSASSPCGVGQVKRSLGIVSLSGENQKYLLPYQGDCDRDNECAGDLVCGYNNCAAGDYRMDCCEPAATTTKTTTTTTTTTTTAPAATCNPADNDWTCCSASSPCGLGQVKWIQNISF